MRNFYIIWLLLATNFCIAQNKLIGYVTEQNSSKKPVPNTIINSSGANQNVSTDKGQFILTFQGLEIGENVVLRPEKAGWELVNEKEMKTLIPAKPNESPVKIVLCKAGTLAIAKQAYYKVADPYIIQQYNKKLAALDKEKATYQDEKAKLQEERNRLQNQLEEYAEEFIRVNLDDASEIERQAIALFKEGKIDESIKLRESLKSGIEIKKAVNYKAKADSTIALHTRNLKALAKDYIFKFDFKAAEQKYEELVLADTTNYNNTFDFAYFLQEQNQFEKAILYYQKALRLAKTKSDVAWTQNNLGILYQVKNDYSAALNAYSVSLEISESIAKINPRTYESFLAMTLSCLGSFYEEIKNYPQALNATKRAITIREGLSKIDSTYEPLVALSYNNLGILYYKKNEFKEALYSYGKAIEIFKHFSKADTVNYKTSLAMIFMNLGNLYLETKDYSAALDSYSKALEIYKQEAKINPSKYEPLVAKTYTNLGNFHKKNKNYSAAYAVFTQALEIFGKLSTTNPEIYEIDESGIIVSLGLIQKTDYQENRQHSIDEFLGKAKEKLSKYTNSQLANNLLEDAKDLEEYFKNYTLHTQIHSLAIQLEKIEIKYSEKIEIQKQIINNYQILISQGYLKYAFDLGTNLSDLAWFQLHELKFTEAEKSAKEALTPTTFIKTEDYDTKIEWANTNLALALLFQDKYEEAVNIYINLKDKTYDNISYKETFLSELEEFEKAGITHPDVVKIRELLKK